MASTGRPGASGPAWYVLDANRVPSGPYDHQEAARRALGRDAATGASESLVWRDGMTEWKPAGETELGEGNSAAAAYSVAAMTYDPNAAGPGTSAPREDGAMAEGASGADVDQASARSAGAGPNPSRHPKSGKRGRPPVTSVYVTGLPDDADEQEVYDVFAKCGIIKQNSESSGGGFKVKLYRDEESGILKGDALVTYVKRPSVDLALQLLDGTPLRPGGGKSMLVREAVFDAKDAGGTKGKGGRKGVGSIMAGGKRPRSAMQKEENSRLAWDGFDDEYPKKDVTVILKHMFDMRAIIEEYANSSSTLSQTETVDRFMAELEADVKAEINFAIRSNASDEGIIDVVKKIRVLKQTAEGIVSVELKTPEAADSCLAIFDGRVFDGRKISAHRWDGFTFFENRVETAEEQEQRLERFADELETG